MLNRMMRRKLKPSNVPVEVPTPRKLEEIQADYKEGCAALGDRNYRIAVLQAEAAQLQQRLQALNQEASKLEPKKEESSEQK